jgi:heme exporter protein A
MTLQATDLAVARGGIVLLDGMTFRVDSGQALILRGPNGSGKTTLLRTLAGLQPPAAGQVSGAEDRIAYAAHADGIKPTLTVEENLSFWAQVFGTRDLSPAMEAFDLHDLGGRMAGSLSAGQKRRLGLARLLVTGRPIWALDEPTVSLDTRVTGLFAAAVRAHLAGGGAAIIATHIDLGLDAAVLDVSAHEARSPQPDAFGEAFL